MKRLWLPFTFGMLLWQGVILAQPNAKRKESMEVRTFSVPPGGLFTQPTFASGNRADPFAVSVSQERPRTYRERMEFLRQTPKTETAKETLVVRGIEFPQGSSAVFHPKSQTVTVRNTPANLDLVATLIDTELAQGTHFFSISAYLIQASGSTLRLLAANTAGDKEQTQDLQKLLAMADQKQGEVQVLHTAYLNLREGQLGKFEAQNEHEYTQKLRVDAGGRTSVESATRNLGFSFEVEPTFPAGRNVIELNISSDFTQLVSGGSPDSPEPAFQTGHMHTALSLRSGQTRLVSVRPARSDPKSPARDISEGFFLTVHRVQQVLANVPAETSAEPEELVEQAFKVPNEFFDAKMHTDPESIREKLSIHGLKLPKGSHVRLDESRQLIVKTTAEMMPAVEAWLRRYLEAFPKTVNLSVEIIRAPASLVRPLLRESAESSDHTPALKKLGDAMNSGTARRISLTYLEAKDGQRAKTQSYLDRHSLSELSWKGNGPPALDTTRREIGLLLELDPTINANEHSVDLNYILERHFPPVIAWAETLPAPGSQRHLIMPRNEYPRAGIWTADTFIDGSTKIIGVWRPIEEGGKAMEDDVLEVAFMTCGIMHQAPDMGPVKIVATHAPKRPQGAKDNSKALVTRTFKAPPDFYAVATHPYPPTETLAGPPQPQPRCRLPAEILKEYGVPFPEGAQVFWNGATSQLVVMNTEANLDKVDDFVQEIRELDIKSVALTVHLLEAPASQVQTILAAHGREKNHSVALQALLTETEKGSVRSLATLNVIAKSGQRAVVSQLEEQSFLKKIVLSNDDAQDPERDGKSVGSLFEVEPTVSRDGLMVDLSYTLTHHPAAPVRHAENLAAPDAPRIEIPLTDYHVESLETSLTMPTGTTRILSIWKPTGKPEFETQDLLHIAILEVQSMRDER